MSRPNWLTGVNARRPDGVENQRASNLELFYDLVFVFAVTQVSHLFLDELSWTGALHACIALLVVWWAWNYTTWVTNELDPAAPVVRLLLLLVMLASLVMAIAIPDAFGGRALMFALAYVAIQVGRHLFLTFVAAGRGSIERERAGRILIWFIVAGVFWIAGAVVASARVELWLIALAIDYSAPLVLYWVPGLRRLSSATWHVQTSHFTERFQLFIIIALGETVASIGQTTSKLPITAGRAAVFTLAFVSTAAYWWLYFTKVADRSERHLAEAEDRTTMARNAFTYLHVVLVAGIIAAAVAADIVIPDPTRTLNHAEALACVISPVLYVGGLGVLRYSLTGTFSWRRLLAAAICLALYPLGTVAPAITVVCAVAVVMVCLIVVEHFTPAPGQPAQAVS